MEIYNNFCAYVQHIYRGLPQVALGAAASAALSVAANTHPTYTLFNPMDAAKFTGATGIACILFKAITTSYNWFSLENRENSPFLTAASKITFGGLLAYGVHSITNPDKTIASFALLTVQAVGSLVLARIAVKPFVPEDSGGTNIFSLDETGWNMIVSLYQNGPRTVAAAGSAWLAARSCSTLRLDPKVALVFTAATSLLYYATKPLFDALEYRPTHHYDPLERWSNPHYLSRALCLLSLTKVSADKLMLNLPLYKEFAKACAVAGTLIAIFDNFDKVGPFISGFISGSEKPKQPDTDSKDRRMDQNQQTSPIYQQTRQHSSPFDILDPTKW